MNHTPTPWIYSHVSYPDNYGDKYPGGWERKEDGDFECIWSESANRPVCVAQDASSYRASLDWLDEKDAAYLLQCVNAHEALVNALKYYASGCFDQGKFARKAIALAEKPS